MKINPVSNSRSFNSGWMCVTNEKIKDETVGFPFSLVHIFCCLSSAVPRSWLKTLSQLLLAGFSAYNNRDNFD